MFENLKFFGSVTVGERGQIVLPSELRKTFEIEPGDKLLVMGDTQCGHINLVKGEILSKMMEEFGEKFGAVLKESK